VVGVIDRDELCFRKAAVVDADICVYGGLPAGWRRPWRRRGSKKRRAGLRQ